MKIHLLSIIILIVWFYFDSPSKMNWKRRIPEILFKITLLRKMLKTPHKWSVSIVTFVIDLRRKNEFCDKGRHILPKMFTNVVKNFLHHSAIDLFMNLVSMQNLLHKMGWNYFIIPGLNSYCYFHVSAFQQNSIFI